MLQRAIHAVHLDLALTPEDGVGLLMTSPADEHGNADRILLVGPHSKVPAGFSHVLRGRRYPIPTNVEADLQSAAWVKHPELEQPPATHTPSAVLDSWTGPFNYDEADDARGVPGLRLPQIGALHAVHAHWTVDDSVATVVMPTGTGKTETMLAVLTSTKCSRVLVVVPTDALRTQIAEKFLSLGLLKTLRVVPETYEHPIVGILRNRPPNTAALDAIVERSNVVVTTMQIAGQLERDLQRRLASSCAYLFIDEAHHIGAKTWKEFKSHFAANRVLQFTATPFRNDNKPVDGKIIFKYPLKRALEHGYFRKITFTPVSEFDPEKSDRAIAEKAIAQLRSDPPSHILMARVETISRANEVFQHYKDATEFNPILIHSGLTATQRASRLSQLRGGRSRIVVCVDMLGEGFDLPELKVAAFHDIKKSLAITLQLAGRFTRSRSDLGDPTFVANIADVQVRDELKKLYEHEADWNALLEQVAEGAIGEAISLQRFASGFTDLPSDLPLQNLHPAASTVIYKTNCKEWNPSDYRTGIPEIASADKVFSGVNIQERVLLVVTGKKVAVDWLKLPDVFHWTWELYIVHWSERLNALFIHTSTNAGTYKRLAEALAGSDASLVENDAVFRALNGIHRLRLYNVGLKKQLGRLISYTMQAGSDVEAGIDELLKRTSTKSNMFGAGYEHGARTSIGCSRKGRIWSRRVINVDALVKWFESIGDKVFDETIDPDEVLRGTLRPKMISTRPAQVPIRVDWPESFYIDDSVNHRFDLGGGSASFHQLDIELVDPTVSGDIRFVVATESHKSEFTLALHDRGATMDYSITNTSAYKAQISFRGGMTLEEFFSENPPVFWFADGSSLEGNTHIELNQTPPGISDTKLEVWPWNGIDLKVESQAVVRSNGIEKRKDSIQYQVIQELLNEKFEIVFNDDGSGEIADVVAIRTVQGQQDHVEIRLYHCKYSSESTPGARLKDLYEVCGQAQRSAYWRENPERLMRQLQKRNPLRKDGYELDRFERGDKGVLEILRRKCEVVDVRMSIYIVQPGISRASLGAEHKKLLGITDHYLLETYELPLKVIVSV